RLHIPGIAVRALGPDEIATAAVVIVGVVGNNGAVNRIRVPGRHVLVYAVGIGHYEIVQHVLCSSRARESLCWLESRHTHALQEDGKAPTHGYSSGPQTGGLSRGEFLDLIGPGAAFYPGEGEAGRIFL